MLTASSTAASEQRPSARCLLCFTVATTRQTEIVFPTSVARVQGVHPAGEGDYYYTAAVWGGYLEEMYKLVKYCYLQSEEDAKHDIEAVWQEESHLNRYLLYNKPTKVLSPNTCGQTTTGCQATSRWSGSPSWLRTMQRYGQWWAMRH
ncbi:hypothetical protein INR49_028815 [Caranx melampygus]|nr:hypothetical protein INR49_028815 [Caranx melampygus]